MEPKTKRDVSLDLIKLIASVLVVNLHSINPSDNDIMQECVYLIGTFAIPIFFLVNGYLRANKDFSIRFTLKVILRYFRFILIWAIILSFIQLIVNHEVVFLSVFWGALIGEGPLFHFWFLSALCIIYLVLSITQTILKKRIVIQTKTAIIAVCVMSVSFLTNVFLNWKFGSDIRDYVYAPLRIVTNGGFFVLGMYFRNDSFCNDKIRNKKIALPIICICYVALAFMPTFTSMIWASSYYSFFSTGVWVLHPFVLKALNKIATGVGLPNILIVNILELITCIIACVLISYVFRKIRLLKYLIEP